MTLALVFVGVVIAAAASAVVVILMRHRLTRTFAAMEREPKEYLYHIPVQRRQRVT